MNIIILSSNNLSMGSIMIPVSPQYCTLPKKLTGLKRFICILPKCRNDIFRIIYVHHKDIYTLAECVPVTGTSTMYLSSFLKVKISSPNLLLRSRQMGSCPDDHLLFILLIQVVSCKCYSFTAATWQQEVSCLFCYNLLFRSGCWHVKPE